MAQGFKTLPASFYRTAAGHEPVREWLKAMSPDDRKNVGDDIRDCEFGWPVGLPLCRPMAGARGLWEIRSDLTGGRIARVLFAVVDERMVLLHGFIKKTRKTPERELALAVRRMKELRRHE